MTQKKFEKNPLTNQPGGYTVVLRFSNGNTTQHANIKSPQKYAEKVASESLKGGIQLLMASVKESEEVVYPVK